LKDARIAGCLPHDHSNGAVLIETLKELGAEFLMVFLAIIFSTQDHAAAADRAKGGHSAGVCLERDASEKEFDWVQLSKRFMHSKMANRPQYDFR